MADWFARFAELPAYEISALVVLLLYALETELRFGARARTMRSGASDKKSTWVLSASSLMPVFRLILAVNASAPSL